MVVTVFFTLLALVIVASSLLAGVRAYRQGVHRRAIAITSPNGVQAERFVRIGGVDQWISIRGQDRGNPVLLFVHGGPGNAMSGLTYRAQGPLEGPFTVVQWDQRGAGKTFARHGKAHAGEMSIDRIVRDGIEVAEWLRAELGKDRILLVGLSWGSLIGTEMALRRPDLFTAFVGTGQVVDMQRGEAVSYATLMERLKARGEAKALARLQAIGAPPYPNRKALLAQRRLLFASGSDVDRVTMRKMPATLLFAPGLSLRDVWATLAANFFSIDALYEALMAYDIRRLGTRFEVPMIYIQGADDIQTPTVLVEAYFETIDAPRKALVLIQGGAHMAAITHLDAFCKALVEHALPLAT
jgi:pimeloyl-ACP methyl ester carboxylesterase